MQTWIDTTANLTRLIRFELDFRCRLQFRHPAFSVWLGKLSEHRHGLALDSDLFGQRARRLDSLRVAH